MLKLLRADFFCLRRSRALWLCAAAAFILSSAYMLRASADSMQTLEQNLLQVFPFLPILHAAFVSLFWGLEYQDGTLRNKLIVGHSRGQVYLSRLLASITGCFGILLAWALSILAGAARLGWFAAPAHVLLRDAAVILLLTAALASILTMLCMLLTNRAVSAVTAILLMFGLLALASAFYNVLCEPELVSAAVMTASGFEVGEPIPNPHYVSGTLRTVYQFVVDTLPTGQAILLANQELERLALSLSASAGLVLLCSAAGMLVFRRKDLK